MSSHLPMLHMPKEERNIYIMNVPVLGYDLALTIALFNVYLSGCQSECLRARTDSADCVQRLENEVVLKTFRTATILFLFVVCLKGACKSIVSIQSTNVQTVIDGACGVFKNDRSPSQECQGVIFGIGVKSTNNDVRTSTKHLPSN